jgi:hypothetical protein
MKNKTRVTALFTLVAMLGAKLDSIHFDFIGGLQLSKAAGSRHG